MKKIAILFSVLLASVAVAQTPQTGTKAWADQQQQQQRNSDPAAVQNGNGSLGFLYDSTACGLNYTQSSTTIGQRFSPAGAPQPAALPIANLPSCAQIDKAYLWCTGSGNGVAITATVTNPLGGTANFPMTIIGQDVDMCWGYAATYSYRADVTSIINGNGNYIISGLPTISSNTGNDMDGATLMIVYNDISASYTGSIHIDDGCHVVNGGIANHTMNGFNSCAASTFGNGFMIAANLQFGGYTYTVNGSPSAPAPSGNWWDVLTLPASIAQSQSACNFSLNSGGDCFCLTVAGLYTQTSCNSCTPVTSSLSITNPSLTAASCTANGAATIAVTGGSGNYSITWTTNPVQTGLTATSLPAGVYNVAVVDNVTGDCGGMAITIPYTGPVLSMSIISPSCSSPGSATVSVSGGTAPYTYAWSPSGGNAATATNLSPGTYTVTVTDATGCVIPGIAVIPVATSMTAILSSSPDSCPSPSGQAVAIVSGGSPPYTYSWMPSGQTTASASNLTAGVHTITITDGAGCTYTSSVMVATLSNQMSVDLGPNYPYICGDSVTLVASTPYPGSTFVWSPATYLSNTTNQSQTFLPYSAITYTVTATSSCGTATDVVTVYPGGLNPYSEPICFVTVDTSINKNVIIWERTNSPANGNYRIYRETSSAGVYAVIGTQPISQFTTYTDMTANPMNYASRYRITTVDSCGVQSDSFPQHHRTLFLQVSPSIPSGYNLAWTGYEGLTIPTYDIYRGPSPGNLTLINSVPGTTFNYTDPTPPPGATYYMVEAVHPNGGCTPSLRLLEADAMRTTNPTIQSTGGSLSNIFIVDGVGINENESLQNSMQIVPNPGSGNFQLTMLFGNAQEIQVMVYDNLGRVVFTQNQNAGSGIFTSTLDLSMLSSGVYSVQVRTEHGFAAKRLVVE